MTMPDERFRAVMFTKKFLENVAYNTKDYARVPKHVRQEARSMLRHYPDYSAMRQAADHAPDVFQEQMEPVTRLMAQYEQGKKNGQEA